MANKRVEINLRPVAQLTHDENPHIIISSHFPSSSQVPHLWR